MNQIDHVVRHRVEVLKMRTTFLRETFSRPAALSFVFVFGFSLLVYWWMSSGGTGYDDQVDLARALVHGHFYLDSVPFAHFNYNGHVYCFQPPGVALLLAPFVWLRAGVNQVHASLVFGALGVAIAWSMVRRGPDATMVERGSDRSWLTLFFALGTVYTWLVTVGDGWSTALSFTVPFSLIAIKETFMEQDGHPCWAGLCAGFAALCRYDLLLAWPLYAISWRRRKLLVAFALGVLPALVMLLLYNYERFGTIFMTGYRFTALNDPLSHGGISFSIIYLPHNLYALLFRAPLLDNVWPYMHPISAGQALIFTSPAFLAALRVEEKSLRVLLLWLLVIAVSLPTLFYFNDGFPQFGARHYVQIYPFLFALMLLHSEEHGLDQLDKILIGCSLFFVLFSLWHIHYYNWNPG